jgi:hypothetical protein
MIHRLFASPTLYSTLAMFFDFPRQELMPGLIAPDYRREVNVSFACSAVAGMRGHRLPDGRPPADGTVIGPAPAA